MLLGGFLACALPAQTPTPVPVTTWRYDLTHAGQNTKETALTPANVNPNTFGKLFSMPVDSTVYAQPLYVPGLTMNDGLVHNVVFVATENDTVYAFDADSNSGANASPLWKASMLTLAHGATTSTATAVPYQDTGSPDVAPTVGITGTPAIDLATNTMYFVANTKENGAYFSRLHALNIITGAERSGSPVDIKATVAGTGAGSSNGQITFSPLWQNQRTPVNFYNGYVYFGYSAHGDVNAWHGWLFAYNASTLQRTAVLCLTPGDHGAGVWGSGAGMPIDTSVAGGRMFVVTGNGARSAAPPFTASTNYGESVVAFNIANGQLTPVDEFTSFNYKTLNNSDWDLGSGGLLMLPDQPGSFPHELITAGKEGRVTVLNRDSLGGYASGASSNTNAVQDIPGVTAGAQGFWSTAAYWNGNVYMWPAGEKTGNVGMQFKMNAGLLDTTPVNKTTASSNFPSPTFSISSNGESDGVAWAVRADQFNTRGPAVLYAYDANDIGTQLYASSTKTRDTAGVANKFSVPVVTNGKVYFACRGEVDVYGLLNNQPEVANPDISPNGGTFSSAQTVTLSDSTSSATIYYTLDGTIPTPSSKQYTGPITISTNTTLKAMATATGYVQSGVATAIFTFTTQTPAPTFSPAAGTYSSAQTVTISDSDTSAKVYYTTNGTTPTSSSTLYSGAITVSSSETIKAIAIDSGKTNSNVVSAAYVIQTGTINFANGFPSTAGLQLNGSTKLVGTALELTQNTASQTGSVFWKTPENVQSFTTSFHFQVVNPQANGLTFTIQNVGPAALGAGASGLGYQNITKSVAVKFNFYNYNSEGADSTGVYTGGQAPVTPTVDMSGSGVLLKSGDNMRATVAYNGTTLSLTVLDTVTSKKFTWSKAIDIPTAVGGNTAYFGFTGATSSGSLTSTIKIPSWTYSSTASTGSFSLSASAFNLTWQGAVKHIPVTVTPSGGFKGTVTLSCSVTGPTGATSVPKCTISAQPPAITGTAAVTGTAYVTSTSTTSKDSYKLWVKGVSGSISNTISIPFSVQ